MPNCRLWYAGSLLSSSMIVLGSVPFCSSWIDQHLVLVGAVDSRLTRSHALAGNDDRLHTHQKLIVTIDAGGRGNDHSTRRAIERNHRPGRPRAVR